MKSRGLKWPAWAQALDFLHSCVRNPQPCPVLEVREPGDAVLVAPSFTICEEEIGLLVSELENALRKPFD